MTWSPPPQSYRPLTLSSGLRAAALRDPDKTALIQGAERRSYATVVRNLNQIANLASGGLGLGPGDNAAIIAPNCMEYLEIVAGVSDTGAAMATPSPRLGPLELTQICNDAQARVLFIHPDCADALDLSKTPSVRHVVRLGEPYEALKGRASDAFEPPAIDEWSTFAIPYTSGTTGRPKGVMLSHRSRTLAFLSYAAEYGIYSPDDHFLAIAPMCHGAGFAFAFAAIFLGGTTEIMSGFDPEAVLGAIHRQDVTGLFTVPTHFHGFFDLSSRKLARLRKHRLAGIVANAAPLTQGLKEQVIDYFGGGLLHETYGSTEAGVVSNLRPKDQLRKKRCVGQPFVGNRVRLLRADGTEADIDEVGELFSTSPCLFNGYWQKPEETAAAYRDGLVSVGDMASRDEEGFLYIVDRKKDMVISGGINVYPREIEILLDAHPAVRESAVVGAPDRRWGERLVAYVVLNQPTLEADLAAYCRSALAPYKVPKSFNPVDALPRNANGKILKTSLRALHAGGAGEV